METIYGINELQITNTANETRARKFRYASRIGGVLAEKLAEYSDSQYDYLDLTDEITLTRIIIGEKTAAYSYAANLPLATPGRKAIIDLAELDLQCAIDRTANLCVQSAKIQASRNGKLDAIMLQSIATTLAEQVERGLLAFAPALEAGGADVGQVTDYISGLVGQAFGRLTPMREAYGVGFNDGAVSARPTQITPDQIALAMDDTVPYVAPGSAAVNVEPDTAASQDAQASPPLPSAVNQEILNQAG